MLKIPNAGIQFEIYRFKRSRGIMAPSLSDELQKHEFRLQDPDTAHHVWHRMLSHSERLRLGSLEDQYRDGRTVGIWMRAKNVSRELAIVQLSIESGLPRADATWMLEELGETLPDDYERVPDRPNWNRERGELTFTGEVARQIARVNQARNIVLILDAFQEEGWPMRIDDPLPGNGGAERLGDTLRRLREGLSAITFERDGTGQGITWRRLD